MYVPHQFFGNKIPKYFNMFCWLSSPNKVDSVAGVVKAYTTSIGSRPFPTELQDKIGDQMQSVGPEFGVTTCRVRKCGWLDIPLLRFLTLLNGYDCTVFDQLFS